MKYRLLDKKQTYQNVLFFLFAFVIMVFYITPIDPTSASADAKSIWEYIMSLDTDAPIGSYVLYKGIFSVYPYRWFYLWSKFLGLSEFFFVKLYHCLLFSYITAIGIPTIYTRLTGKKNQICFEICFNCCLFFAVEKHICIKPNDG